ncbi:hypothetical protein ALC62_15632 [Cyphomyrmex costatus]|uniref:MADF domain-containing protein n=1 Tax=Cyphomyrmex costatus TaxID=456900 RepID=A0A151I6U2_9HYME|nr:hypothetical protein ALC62_15632 [Cyphomyrmex costatus]
MDSNNALFINDILDVNDELYSNCQKTVPETIAGSTDSEHSAKQKEIENIHEDVAEPILQINSLMENIDELFIDLVHDRKSLWDSRLPLKDRINLKRDSLWNEIINTLGGTLTVKVAKQKWKHQGSGAEAGYPLKSTFAHYDRMRFLDDTLNTMPTVNSVRHFANNLTQSSSSSSTDTELFDANINIVDNVGNRMEGLISDTDHSESTVSSTARSNKTEIQLKSEFLELMKTSFPKRDVVDSFVEQLADILRRLPYPKRRTLQRNLMDMAIATEELEEQNKQI